MEVSVPNPSMPSAVHESRLLSSRVSLPESTRKQPALAPALEFETAVRRSVVVPDLTTPVPASEVSDSVLRIVQSSNRSAGAPPSARKVPPQPFGVTHLSKRLRLNSALTGPFRWRHPPSAALPPEKTLSWATSSDSSPAGRRVGEGRKGMVRQAALFKCALPHLRRQLVRL